MSYIGKNKKVKAWERGYYRATLKSIMRIVYPLVLLHVFLSSGACTTLLLNRTDNEVTLRCLDQDSSIPNIYADYILEDPTENQEPVVIQTNSSSGYMFDITPDSEVIASCRSGGNTSDKVQIAALPVYNGEDTITVSVQIKETAVIDCPFRFGRLHGLLSPYEIRWVRVEVNESGSTIQRDLDDGFSPGYVVSGTDLLLPITTNPDTRMYRCEASVRLCNTSCPSLPPSIPGPIVILRLIDDTPDSTITPPPTFTTEHVYAIVGAAVAVIFVIILLLFGMCFLRYHYKYKAETSRIGCSLRRTFSCDPSLRGQRSHRNENVVATVNPFYDEIDPALFKGTTSEMSPQNGVAYAEDNAKAVDPTLFAVNNGNGHYPPLLHDPTAIDQIYNTSQRSGVSGISAYSGLSGVSQNVPGVYHKMPEFSEDSMTNLNLSQPPSDVNSSLLYPPHLTTERSLGTSEISGDSGVHTQTNTVYSGYSQTQDGVAYPHPALQASYQLPPHCSSHSDHGIAPQVYPPGEPGLHNLHQSSSHPQLYSDQSSHSQTHSINSQGSEQHLPANVWYSPQMRSGTPPIQQYKQQVVNNKTLLMVLNCLMHKDCQIEQCPCRKVQERYRNLLAGCYPISTTPEQTSSNVSTDFNSDPDPANKRSRLQNLPDVDPQYPNTPNLQPHFHLRSKSHLRHVYRRQPHSKSLFDLTPVTEVSETPGKTPMIGGSLVAGTHIRCPGTLGDSDSLQEASSPEFCEEKASPILKEISLSADNLPALRLNGCPFTPSPLKTCRNLGLPVFPQYPNIPNLHPHFHFISKSHLHRVYPRQPPRTRSKSLSDLTPVMEVTPIVGGSLVAGTPIRCPGTLAPPLLREISLSADNLPALCLNGCPFTPSSLKTCHNIESSVKPKKQWTVSAKTITKLSVTTMQENLETDSSNTSSHSPSPSVHKSNHEHNGIETDFDFITCILEKVKQSLIGGRQKKVPGVSSSDSIIVWECDHSGREYYIAEHDITIRIPPGAIPKGEIVHFEVAVTLYGPFLFPENEFPISAILWLCPQEDTSLKKPIEIIMPHCLTDLSMEELGRCGTEFVKANHNHFVTDENGRRLYKFEHNVLGTVQFQNDDKCHKSYGILKTTHFCYICITDKRRQEHALKVGFYFNCVQSYMSSPCIPQRKVLYFCVTFGLPSCIEALKQQYSPSDGFEIILTADFKFKDDSDPHLRMDQHSDIKECIIATIPADRKIFLSDIDFWKAGHDEEQMVLRHKQHMYPPRIKMTVGINSDIPHFTLHYKFKGCRDQDERKLNMQMMLPRVARNLSSSISSSSSRHSSQSLGSNPQSGHHIKQINFDLRNLTVLKVTDSEGKSQNIRITNAIQHQ